MRWTLQLWVEGPTDAKATIVDERPAPAQGALAPLVRRVLQVESGLSKGAFDGLLPAENVEVAIARHQLRGTLRLPGRRDKVMDFQGKVMAAIATHRALQPTHVVVVVWDSDGRQERVRQRDAILEELRSKGMLGATVAVCIPMVEAWLLGDPAVFVRALGRGPKRPVTAQPEKHSDPKAALREVLDEVREVDDPRGAVEVYAVLAESIDIENLSSTCPGGFRHLRRSLRERIVPCLLPRPVAR